MVLGMCQFCNPSTMTSLEYIVWTAVTSVTKPVLALLSFSFHLGFVWLVPCVTSLAFVSVKFLFSP